MGSVVIRAILTVLVFFAWRVLDAAIYGATTLASGQLAGQQFQNSNEAYLRTQTGFALLSGPGLLLTIGMLVILLLVWGKYLKMGYKYLAAAMVIVVLLMSGSNANAYYAKQDLTEIYQILPNQTVFWVPDVGANKDSQAQFDSEAYLRDARIPGKRYQIKHEAIVGSTGWSERDYYGPVGRLYVVVREPFNRKWTGEHTTGTSAKNEAFTCQSIEGLNVTMETTIGTKILPENAYKYLYNFGIKSPGDPKLPEVVFTSVYYARDLAEIMDNVVHGNIYGLACQEFSTRTLDTINLERDKIQKEIEKNARAYLIGLGITLDYLGYAGTFSFDHDVQRAINDRYTADHIAPVLPILQTKAILDALNKWDGKLPASLSGLWLIPSDIGNALSGLLKQSVDKQ